MPCSCGQIDGIEIDAGETIDLKVDVSQRYGIPRRNKKDPPKMLSHRWRIEEFDSLVITQRRSGLEAYPNQVAQKIIHSLFLFVVAVNQACKIAVDVIDARGRVRGSHLRSDRYGERIGQADFD